MKLKVLFTSLLIAFAVIASYAQPPQGGGQGRRMDPEKMAKSQTDRMVEDLKLNDKQTTEVQAINLKYSKKMGEIFQAGAGQGDREANRKKMDEMNIQKNAELKKVFTAEQYKKYEELEKQRQEERGKRTGERPGGAPGGTETPNGQRGGQRGGAR
jgi:periplasmic protein CpxP/Spy